MRLCLWFPRSCFAVIYLVVVGGVTAASGQCCDSAGGTTPVRGEPISLFDGVTLDEWATRTGGPVKNWVVKDGAIFRQSSGGDLYHNHWYRDFELTFEWKTSAKGNSGIKYRVYQYGNAFLGCEYQLQDDKKGLFDKQATGSIYAIYEPNQTKRLNPVGQWNESKIVVCGNHVEHWLNGSQVVEATIGSPDWLSRVAESKFNQREYFGQNREGRIFLQDHGTDIWFRHITLVPLDCDNTAQSSAEYK